MCKIQVLLFIEMIHITQGSSNHLIFTAFERETQFTPDTYTLKLYRDNELSKTIDLGVDLSDYPTRFNLFLLSESDSDFGFNQMGKYQFDYKLYGVADDQQELTEQGICFVYKLTEDPLFKQHQTNNTFIQRS